MNYTEGICWKKRNQNNISVLTAFICIAYHRCEIEENISRAVNDDEYYNNLFKIVSLVSLPFYLPVFLVYTLMPEFRTFHGYCLSSFAFHLFITELMDICINYYSDWNYAFAFLFFVIVRRIYFLGSYFWMNVMCIDIWLTFRGDDWYKMLSKRKKMITSTIYIWSASSLYFLCVYIYMYVTYLNKFEEHKCFRYYSYNKSYFTFFPVIVVLCVNLVAFILTVKNIWNSKEKIMMYLKNKTHGRSSYEQQRFMLYLKLYLTCGLYSCFDLLLWYFYKTTVFTHVILETINKSHGIFIFLVVICRRKFYKMLKNTIEQSSFIRYFQSSRTSTSTSTSTLQL